MSRTKRREAAKYECNVGGRASVHDGNPMVCMAALFSSTVFMHGPLVDVLAATGLD
jgi:hypothetical protein